MAAPAIDDLAPAGPSPADHTSYMSRSSDSGDNSPMSRAVRRAIQSMSHLSNFLPTGTALIFQFLLPIVSDAGKCPQTVDKCMTGILLAMLAVFCCFISFTDTYIAADGNRYYGIATRCGLWIPAGASRDVAAAAANAAQYKLRFSDFIHAGLSVVVFAASSLFDSDVKGCFHCSFLPAHLQTALPVVIAFVASLCLLIFPSTRLGFDEPPPIPPPAAILASTTPISKPLLIA